MSARRNAIFCIAIPLSYIPARSVFKFAKTPAKTLVKPQTHPSYCQTTTSIWHFSYTQTAILDIERKMENQEAAGDTLSWLTRLDAIFCRQLICFEYFTGNNVPQVVE
jgi:hypothetical protein